MSHTVTRAYDTPLVAPGHCISAIFLLVVSSIIRCDAYVDRDSVEPWLRDLYKICGNVKTRNAVTITTTIVAVILNRYPYVYILLMWRQAGRRRWQESKSSNWFFPHSIVRLIQFRINKIKTDGGVDRGAIENYTILWFSFACRMRNEWFYLSKNCRIATDVASER